MDPIRSEELTRSCVGERFFWSLLVAEGYEISEEKDRPRERAAVAQVTLKEFCSGYNESGRWNYAKPGTVWSARSWSISAQFGLNQDKIAPLPSTGAHPFLPPISIAHDRLQMDDAIDQGTGSALASSEVLFPATILEEE
ncbi:hypothetical protein ZIOFF_038606 [Zingiber officinale]|uniref:Uncharacterized protein n=1 Tax=Zingiber officinale TaxID=94328 RepID=A0A8J5G3B7_ZINOF|nr:hypothetical protein ZIOFF_038606 [Zingiber officinale]